jgi:hypothetical protein
MRHQMPDRAAPMSGAERLRLLLRQGARLPLIAVFDKDLDCRTTEIRCTAESRRQTAGDGDVGTERGEICHAGIMCHQTFSWPEQTGKAVFPTFSRWEQTGKVIFPTFSHWEQTGKVIFPTFSR